MERLTEKNFNFTTDFVKSSIQSWSIAQALKKLQEYEDLEEEGMLLRLPCAAGNMTYRVHKIYGITEAFVKRIEQDRDGAWVITTAGVYSFDDFGKTVFLTREKAEAALKELEENHAESS